MPRREPPLEQPDDDVGAERHDEVDRADGGVEEEVVLRRAGRLLGGVEELGKADDADQRGVLQEDHPEIAEAGQRDRQHRGDHHAPQPQEGRHAVGARRLDLPARDGQDGAAQHLRLIGALHDPEHADGRGKAADLDLAEAQPGEQRGDPARAGVIEQDDEEQLRHGADEGRVAFRDPEQDAAAAEFCGGAAKSQHQPDSIGGEGDLQGHQRALEQGAAPSRGLSLRRSSIRANALQSSGPPALRAILTRRSHPHASPTRWPACLAR